MKDVVAAATVTAPNDVADFGDLTYDPTLTHRLVIQIGGNTRGTGTNTANGVQVTPGVPMANPINLVYDFIPATGKAVTATDTQREIVKVANCFECHGKFSGIHGGNHLQGTPGSRQDTRTCVLCHTEQQKYGFAEATTTATGYSGDTRKINGQAVGYFPAFIHRIHMGEELTKTGYKLYRCSCSTKSPIPRIREIAASAMPGTRRPNWPPRPRATTGRPIPAGKPAAPATTRSTLPRGRTISAAVKPMMLSAPFVMPTWISNCTTYR